MSDRLTHWALLFPALLVMVVSGVVPAAFVAFYSVHDTFAGNSLGRAAMVSQRPVLA